MEGEKIMDKQGKIYDMVTERIMDELKKGIVPWKKPWVGERGAISHTTGKPYSLLNQILLGKDGEWITFSQAIKEGGCVKKGEKGRFVVFWKFLEVKDEKAEDENTMKKIPYLKYTTVFHIDQCEGIKPRYETPAIDLNPDKKAQSIFDDYVSREGIKVNLNGDAAYYRPSDDSITLPNLNRFSALAEYYSTAFHEAIHSTGAKPRLDRDGITVKSFFGSDDYSKEELIAEIGSSMIINSIGMETDSSFTNNVAYIENWLSVLKNDHRFIVSAAGKAEKAAKFILKDADESKSEEEAA